MNLINTSSLSRLFSAAGLALAVGLAPAGRHRGHVPAPPFSLLAVDGKPVSLAGLRGRYVYVDFWASWCGPCKQSFPWMNQLQAKLGGPRFQVLAINVDEKQSDAARFLAEVPPSFTVVFDGKGVTPAAYGVQGMPTSFLIDPDGKVVFVHQSFKDGERGALEQKIGALVGGAKP